MGRGDSNSAALADEAGLGLATRGATCPLCESLKESCGACSGALLSAARAAEINAALAARWDEEQVAEFLAEGQRFCPCQGSCGKSHWLAPGVTLCTSCWRAQGGSLSPVGQPMPRAAKQLMPLADKERLLALHNQFSGKILKRGSVFTEFSGLDDAFAHVERTRADELEGTDRQKLIDLGYKPTALHPEHRFLASHIGNGDLFFLEVGPDPERGGDAEKLFAVHDAVSLAVGECHGDCGSEYGNFGCPRCASLRAHHPMTLLEGLREEAASTSGRACHACIGGIAPECCGNPTPEGECCGQAVPGQCGNCFGSGVEPETTPGNTNAESDLLPF